jgi:hypothetical protein
MLLSWLKISSQHSDFHRSNYQYLQEFNEGDNKEVPSKPASVNCNIASPDSSSLPNTDRESCDRRSKESDHERVKY